MGEALRGTCGCGEEPEEEQRADCLGGLGGADADESEEGDAEDSDGDAAAVATASSMLAKRRGRATVMMATQTPRPIQVATVA